MFDGAPIPRDHIYAKARLLSEGVRLPGAEPPSAPASQAAVQVDPENVEDVLQQYARSLESREITPIKEMGNVILFDNSEIACSIVPNRYSRLDLERDGGRITIADGDDVLITGQIPTVPAWTKQKLSNGLPIMSLLPVMSEGIINVVFTLSCMNYNSGRGCRYCNLFANPVAKQLAMLPLKTLEGYARYQAEAVKIATDAGWCGTLSFSGGALPPSLRGELFDRIAIVMDAVRDALDPELFRKLPKVYNNYPPENLDDMGRLKDLGITATSIDLEVMDPAYFAAICPGKHAFRPLEYWKKAQEVSVEVFGPYANTTGMLVVGLEPMECLVEGMEERMSKGVLPLPFVFYSAPGSAYWGFRPPNADWLVETFEKVADVFMKYAPQVLQTLPDFGGEAPPAPSFGNSMLFDEVQRRVRVMMAGGMPAAVVSQADSSR